MDKKNVHFKSPQILFDKYQQVKVLGWNASRIGIFLNSYLLLGLQKDKKMPAQIDERSFQALIKYTNKIAEAHIVKIDLSECCTYDLLTPSELLEEYPQLHVLGWTPTKVGIFLSCKLLIGYHKGVGRSCHITRRSFILLVNHVVGTIERRKMILSLDFPKPQ